MEDEIKEIIDYLKKKENTRRIKCITIEESKILLDYIENKDKEIDRLNNIRDKANKIINTIFEEENWYQNYDYNDLVDKLKELKEGK